MLFNFDSNDSSLKETATATAVARAPPRDLTQNVFAKNLKKKKLKFINRAQEAFTGPSVSSLPSLLFFFTGKFIEREIEGL